MYTHVRKEKRKRSLEKNRKGKENSHHKGGSVKSGRNYLHMGREPTQGKGFPKKKKHREREGKQHATGPTDICRLAFRPVRKLDSFLTRAN